MNFNIEFDFSARPHSIHLWLCLRPTHRSDCRCYHDLSMRGHTRISALSLIYAKSLRELSSHSAPSQAAATDGFTQFARVLSVFYLYILLCSLSCQMALSVLWCCCRRHRRLCLLAHAFTRSHSMCLGSQRPKSSVLLV